MAKIVINRLKIVLAEKNMTNRVLAQKLGVAETTVSRWVTNDKQPSVETFYNIAVLLDINLRELFVSTKPKL
ncbi:DNA-binding transcriptional regulator, XRE-family HTH domain [Chitinophaga sp. CF118]|uniref:helix-turn-helix transcriptional regulator n=1 Tax=Chitinophaga sp. CF118 TaxID=1884367 RepID=UPI0008ECCBE8|nr:helix-turn-helix transcriptional regulator [Chitinophaga sp. CF118]SFE67974.1 DNA-binding transcriptional regulator, XRE-family HTH domain [Chitinophaga sp. CF118]